jgi:hypothetical protein
MVVRRILRPFTATLSKTIPTEFSELAAAIEAG